MVRRQDLDEIASSGVVEAHRPADQRRRRPAAAVAKNLVAVADLLSLEVENPRRRRAGLASQVMSLALRDEREVPGSKQRRLGAVGLEQDLARRRHVEPHVPRHREQGQAPGRAQLRAAVEGPAHAQKVKGIRQRIGRRPRVDLLHRCEYAASCRHRPQSWTFEHESTSYSHRQSRSVPADWTY